ncbi:MAG: hypothetical protein NDI90_16120 [Nitrospira sp. BO4]|jgi:hypothetical protein|nr:hypothetical protein [Nitrospira sp. BO4]
MAQQSLIWTALPNGFTPDRSGLRLSVMLSPRLDPEAPIGKLGMFFPDWEDWPQTLSSARFDVTYNGSTVSISGTTLVGPNRADSVVWKAVFDATTNVKGFQYIDRSPSVLLSYDAGLMAQTIEELYKDLAGSATDQMLRVSELLDNRRWKGFISNVRELDRSSIDPHTGLRDPGRQFNALRRGLLEIDNPTLMVSQLFNMLTRFQLFHTPPAASVVKQNQRLDDLRIKGRSREHLRTDLPKPEDIGEMIDFHQIVAAMGSYPTLLRRLGFVVDLVLDPGSFAASAAADLSVRVVFPAGALQIQSTVDGAPVTRARLSATRFDAVPDPSADNLLADGLLDLQPTRYGLLQVDVDGAGLKAMNLARSLGRRVDDIESRVDPTTRYEDEIGTPSLRTAGLMLVQKERAGTLKKRFDENKIRNAQLESQLSGGAATVKLHAQDLVRGYRIDIWDSVTARWHSLCQRTARYELGDVPPVVVPEEESTVRLAATRSSDETSNTDILYLHEILVSWSGWSLAARPPGRAISVDDTVDKTRDDSDAKVPPGLNFKSSFVPVKGSLPRLRFGRSYWIRARAVDLAGNSLAPLAQDYGNEQPLIHARPYLRYEPVAAPVVALLSESGTVERPLEGESMNRIAIRSFNDTAAGNLVTTAQVAHRAAAPPQVSVRDAEQHGMLDAEGKVNADLFNLLAHQMDVDPRNPLAAIREEKLLTQGPLDTAGAQTSFAVYENGRALTYLPDPLATEVAVRVFDHPNIADTKIIRIPLYSSTSWPEARPFVIEVYDHPNESPYYDATAHRLRVPLPKAVWAKLRLSMALAPEALSLMGVFQWLAAADQNAQRDRALSGQHWMLTPWTLVEVVHAVQRPLLNPDFVALSILDRSFGETSALPLAQVRCNIDSTDRLDLYGEWHEPSDDPLKDSQGPVDRHRRDVAFQVKITGPQHYALNNGISPGTPEHTISSSDMIGINGAVHQRIAAKAHEFHDTRYRRIEYWFDATSRFREFLPGSLLTTLQDGKRVPTDVNIKITGTRQVTWVPSSAPPPAPKVLYVVPTFAWRREVDEQGNFLSWRRGGGLRIYLDRDWNASGYGEMLGVVLPPKEFVDDPNTAPAGAPYKNYVTLWGNDPIWASGFVPGLAPTLAHFPLARTAPDPTGAWLPPNAPVDEKDQRPGPFLVSSLPISGLQGRGSRVDVAPHDVFYDEARQLWYCDVEIASTAAYFPFIRLALARYQPTSSPDVHLSNVVLSDIMALTADRWVNVTPASDARKIRVAVFGVSYSESSAHREATDADSTPLINRLTGRVEYLTPATVSERSIVQVWVERLDTRWGEDFGWYKVSEVIISQRIPVPATSTSELPVALESIFGRVVSSEERLQTRDLFSARDVARLTPSRLVDLIHMWQTLWEGDIVFPEFPTGDRHRLVIAEYEEYLIDDDHPYDKTPTRKGHRLVFVEHIEFT